MVVRYGNGQVKEKMSDIEKKWMDQLVKHKDLCFCDHKYSGYGDAAAGTGFYLCRYA